PCSALVVDLVCHSINGAPRLFGNLEREHGLAGPGLAFDQQRTLERDGGLHRDLEVAGRDIAAGPFEISHVASTKALPTTPAPRFAAASHEREPNCRDRRWQNALYTGSDHPLAPTPGGPRAAPNKQKLGRPTGWARFVVRPRPLCERRRAGERAAEN